MQVISFHLFQTNLRRWQKNQTLLWPFLCLFFFNSSINSEDWSLQFELLTKNSQRTHYALKYVQCKNQERKLLHETTNFYTNKKIALNHYIFALVIARRCFILNRAKWQLWDIIQQIFFIFTPFNYKISSNNFNPKIKEICSADLQKN